MCCPVATDSKRSRYCGDKSVFKSQVKRHPFFIGWTVRTISWINCNFPVVAVCLYIGRLNAFIPLFFSSFAIIDDEFDGFDFLPSIFRRFSDRYAIDGPRCHCEWWRNSDVDGGSVLASEENGSILFVSSDPPCGVRSGLGFRAPANG